MSSLSTLSDHELADLLKAGERSAFTEIYDRFFGVLYLHAYNRLRDKDAAKDVVQEMFAGLWSKHRVLNLTTNLSNYLYSSIRNRIINEIAHKQVEARYLLSLPDSVNTSNCITDHRLREKQLASIIEKEIQALPPRMREVFELSRKANLTHKEIAEQLDISEQSVRSHIKNALKILRIRLGLFIYLVYIFKFF